MKMKIVIYSPSFSSKPIWLSSGLIKENFQRMLYHYQSIIKVVHSTHPLLQVIQSQMYCYSLQSCCFF